MADGSYDDYEDNYFDLDAILSEQQVYKQILIIYFYFNY